MGNWLVGVGKGQDFQASLSVNGIQVLDKEEIIEGHPISRTIDIEIGKEVMLELILTDKWTISVLEIIPKQNSPMSKLKTFIASILPGIFLIGYNVGTGSITSMSKAGANFGLDLL